jgi:hypothetical protein
VSFDRTRKLHLGDIDTELLNAAWDTLFRVMRDLAPDLVARLGEIEPAEWIRECNLGGSEGDWVTRFAEETKKLWIESEQIREHLGPAQIISVGMVGGHRVRKNTKRDPTLAG